MSKGFYLGYYCLVKKGIEEAADHFSPFQLGVGVKGRCESIIHAASSIIADKRTPVEDKWVLQVDMDNAFNSISREKMLVEVCKVCPKLYAFSKYCCENLYFGPHWINSTTGAQQSDPLAILFFTLVAPLIKRIKDESPGLLLNAWYLDDGTIVGNRNKLTLLVFSQNSDPILASSSTPRNTSFGPEMMSLCPTYTIP